MRNFRKACNFLGLKRRETARRALMSPKRLALAESGAIRLEPHEVSNLIYVLKLAVSAQVKRLDSIRRQIESGKITK